MLYPGDRLHIPDMETGVKEGCATEEKHRFRLHTSTLMLRMVLKDINDEPIANKDCVLKVEATEFPLLTDGEGLIEQSIPITARRAWLTVDDIEQSLLIGELDPVIQSSGQRSRLNNLGYRAGPIGCDCEHRLLSAIEEFQCNNDLAVDGDCGPNTQAKLIEIHGC